MNSGKFANAFLNANILTDIYAVPDGYTAACHISICNSSSNTAIVHVAVSASAIPVDADWVEYGARIAPGGVAERIPIMMSQGEHVLVKSTTPCTVRIDGIEEVVTESASEAGSSTADMRRSTYDPNGDGKVSAADVADGISDGHTIEQSKVAGLPESLAAKFNLPSFTAKVGVSVTAPAFVNVYDDAGTAKIRPASNDGGDGYQAHGFVTAPATTGTMVTVYPLGFAEGFVGLVAGDVYLGKAGQPTQVKPTTAGLIQQRLGTAVSATKVWYSYSGYVMAT